MPFLRLADTSSTIAAGSSVDLSTVSRQQLLRSSSRVCEWTETSIVSDLASPGSSAGSIPICDSVDCSAQLNRLQLCERLGQIWTHVSQWWVGRHRLPLRLGRLGFRLPPALSAVQFLRDPVRDFRICSRPPARPLQGFHLHLGPPDFQLCRQFSVLRSNGVLKSLSMDSCMTCTKN